MIFFIIPYFEIKMLVMRSSYGTLGTNGLSYYFYPFIFVSISHDDIFLLSIIITSTRSF